MKLAARNDATGSPVDWWFIYKLPLDAAPRGKKTPKSNGHEYLYYDARSKGLLTMSSHPKIDEDGALLATLNPLKQPGDSTGYLLYNDEQPGDDVHDSETFGHTKGVLAFDVATDSAFWLLHSWPKFPFFGQEDLYHYASFKFGQTYLCITLRSLAVANAIAQQLYYQNEPQIYATRIPDALSKDTYLYKLTQGVNVNETDPPTDIPFASKAGRSFRMIARNRHWGTQTRTQARRDFWIDLVGPHLKTNLNVETWRMGSSPVPGVTDKHTDFTAEDSDTAHEVDDLQYLNLTPLGIDYEWHYTKDHAKWATSAKPNWVCVADINRQESQSKRGGGTICFKHPNLWKSLAQIERFTP